MTGLNNLLAWPELFPFADGRTCHPQLSRGCQRRQDAGAKAASRLPGSSTLGSACGSEKPA
jgi:hypothetical protein